MADHLAVSIVPKMGDGSRFKVFVWILFLCFNYSEYHKVKWLTNSVYFLILIVNLVVETPNLGARYSQTRTVNMFKPKRCAWLIAAACALPSYAAMSAAMNIQPNPQNAGDM